MPVNKSTAQPLLSDVASEYADELNSEYIAASVLPLYGVDVKSGDFNKLPLTNITKDLGNLARAVGAGYDRNKSAWISDNFSCSERGLESTIDDGAALEAEPSFDAEVIETKVNVKYVLEQMEIATAAIVFDTGTWTPTAAIAVWSDVANAKPFQDVTEAKTRLKNKNGGIVGSSQFVLTMNEPAWDELIATDDMKSRFAGGTGSSIIQVTPSKADIARILKVDDILVSNAQFNGNQVWADSIVSLSLRAPGVAVSNSEGKPVGQEGNSEIKLVDLQLGRIFFWRLDANGLWVSDRYREEQTRSWVVRQRQHVDEKIVNTNCNELISV
jgi:hypothetical protein